MFKHEMKVLDPGDWNDNDESGGLLPIPDLVCETIPNETGFTTPEINALRSAWTLLSPYREFYAHELFLDFYTQHERLLDRFRNDDGEFRMRVLHNHPYDIFYMIESMIFDGLVGLTETHTVMSPVVLKHCAKHVQLDEIVLMTDALSDCLKKVMSRFLSPTLDSAINKICKLIVESHQ